ncbi:MFS transporter [Deinococcus sp.]|uniref:MFS transporter n=1 Tax=Deinococcus sp. TaxID=47478 RepID=UPI003C7A4350
MTPDERRATRIPAFNLLWGAETLAVLGQQFSVLALPLLAAVSLKASPVQMGLLAACETAPFLLLSLPAGVLVDRLPKRRVMIWMNLLRALTLLLVPLAALLGVLRLEVLYVVAFLIGSFGAFFYVAYQSMLPDLVPDTALADANSKLEASSAGAEVVGPGLAGAVIGVIGGVAAIWMNIGTFLVSAILLGNLRLSERPTPNTAPRLFVAQLLEGLAFVWSHPIIRPLMLCASTLNVAEGLVNAVLVLYLSRNLHLTPTQIGLIYVGSNIGTLLGAVLSERFALQVTPGRAAVLAALFAGIGMVFTPLAGILGTLAVPVLLLSRSLYGFGRLMFFVQHITLRQSQTPPELQGRMHASVRFLAGGVFPLSALIGGALAQRYGIPAVLLLAALIGASAWLWVARSDVMRGRTAA